MDLSFFFMSSISLLAVINPISGLFNFLAMSFDKTPREKLRIIKNACLVATAVLPVSAIGGNLIFKLFGITLGAFQIAGGLVLLMISLERVRGRQFAVPESDEGKKAMSKEDITITPFAIPMLAGPGAIATVMLLHTGATTLLSKTLLAGLVAAVGFACYLFFVLAVKRAASISPVVMAVVTRLMGLILASTSIQFITDGIKKVFPHLM